MKSIDINNISIAIGDLLSEYADEVYEATEDGLTAAEKVLVRNLKKASPKKSGAYQRGWKGKGKKYKLKRFVGNTKTVEGPQGDIPLSNILEYSTVRGKPFIRATYEKSITEMVAAVAAEIKKEV